MVGQIVGKYRVLDRVGRGGMGTVYRAVDETLQREVAIKVLNAELNEPEVARRFRAEAITVARLSHPGIATIYELFEHDEQWLMVMEFLRGETFEQVVAKAGALEPDEAALLCMQGLSALGHAHNMGVVHRDLKPANIMRTQSGDVKIMDFGIARVSGSEHLTNVGFMMGTPAYMAPEQVQGHEIDARADLYAMGVVFFRLLTGKLPFKGDTPFAMAQAQVNAPPIPIESVRPETPAWVCEILTRALQKQPGDRFQSAGEFYDALQQALVGRSAALRAPAFSSTGAVPTSVRDTSFNLHAETMLTPTATASDASAASSDPHGDTQPLTIQAAMPLTAPRVPPAPPVPAPAPTSQAPVPAGAIPSVPGPVGPPPRAGGRAVWTGAAAALVIVAAGGFWWMSSLQQPATIELPPSTPVANDIALPYSPAVAPAGVGNDESSAAATSPTAGSRGEVSAEASQPLAAPGEPRGTADTSAVADAAPPVEISNVKVLVVDGRRTTDHDVMLNLGSGRIVAVAQRDGTPLVTWPYQAVTAATYVHARNPRWDPQLASPPENLDVGGVFRASRHYLTLQNEHEFVILRLEDINVIQVIRELESRTGVSIPRMSGGN
jgi:serine/threonine protein kinase